MSETHPDARPAAVVVRPPDWVRWLGPPLLVGVWLVCASPVVLAVLERDWMAPVRDSGLGAGGAVAGWVIVGVLLLVVPAALKVLLGYRVVLDADGVEAPFGRGRFEVSQIDAVRWVPQGGPANAANRLERFEVFVGDAWPVARVARGEADWEATRLVLRHWARRRPQIVRDDSTAAALAVSQPR